MPDAWQCDGGLVRLRLALPRVLSGRLALLRNRKVKQKWRLTMETMTTTLWARVLIQIAVLVVVITVLYLLYQATKGHRRIVIDMPGGQADITKNPGVSDATWLVYQRNIKELDRAFRTDMDNLWHLYYQNRVGLNDWLRGKVAEEWEAKNGQEEKAETPENVDQTG